MAMPIIKISYWQPWLIMGLGLLSLAAAANSHEKWYQIEVLIFEHADLSSVTQETWPVVNTGLDLAQATKLAPASVVPPDSVELEAPAEFTQLPDSELRLKDAKQRLIKRNRSRILLHQAWQQSLAKGAPATLVQLNGEQNFEFKHQDGPLADAEHAINLFELVGTIGLRLAQQVQFNAEFILHKPMLTPPENEPQTLIPHELKHWQQIPNANLTAFHLQFKRKLKNKEVVLFDHPILGILVTVEALS
jgi:hypothetical protein